MTRRLRAAWLALGLVAAIVVPMRAWEIAAAHNAIPSFACGK